MAGWKLRKDKTQTETPGTEDGAEPATPVSESLTPPRGASIYAAPVSGEYAAPVSGEYAAPVSGEYAAPVSGEEENADLLPMPVSRWEMPADDWQLPVEEQAVSPVEDEPVAPEELLQEEAFPAAGRFFDLSGDPFTMPGAEAADDDGEDELRFQENDAPLYLEDVSAPPAEEAPILPLPAPDPLPLSPPPPSSAEMDGLTSTLRMDRTELAAAFTPPPAGGIPSVAPFVLDVPPGEAPLPASHRLVMRLGRLSAAFELAKEVTVIGRPDSTLHFYPDVEIELDDAVSRRHAEVLQRGHEFYVVDTGSTNGTLLNGELLPPHEERRLVHGDRIRVGERTELIFE